MFGKGRIRQIGMAFAILPLLTAVFGGCSATWNSVTFEPESIKVERDQQMVPEWAKEDSAFAWNPEGVWFHLDQGSRSDTEGRANVRAAQNQVNTGENGSLSEKNGAK